ncbi:MAG: glycosyltransferase family 4 protein [Proteobacteria bacterium]|nr:glycosyltransferase family 4 protein [Pseudomonadota bacterium]
MRIVLTVNFSPWSSYSGGGQRSTHQLALEMAGRGHEVTVVYTKAPLEKIELPDNLTYSVRFASSIGLKSSPRAVLRPLNALTVARVVSEIITDKGNTIVHSQGEEGALIPKLKNRHCFQFAVTPRYPAYPKALLDKRVSLLRKTALFAFDAKYLVLGHALKNADVCCPTSRASLNHIRLAFGTSVSKCRIIPNGVAPCFLNVARKWNAYLGPVLFFGRMAASKGANTLIEALGLLKDDGPSAILVGRGDELPRLKRKAEALGLLGRVSFKDWKDQKQIAKQLSRASMAVLPSREESFGNAMVEAMAAGTPLITTRVGSIPEVVDENRTGLLVPPDDPKKLASAIRTLSTNINQAEAMGRAGRKHVQDRFSWKATADQYESIYQELQETGRQ